MISIRKGPVVFLCWLQDSNTRSSEPNLQQTECPLISAHYCQRVYCLYFVTPYISCKVQSIYCTLSMVIDISSFLDPPLITKFKTLLIESATPEKKMFLFYTFLKTSTKLGPYIWHFVIFSSFVLSVDLTHWDRVTHICVSKLTTIGSDNGLPPGQRQAIIGTNNGILLIGLLGTNITEILFKIHTFSFKKTHFKMSPGKWRPTRFGVNVLKIHWHWFGYWFDADQLRTHGAEASTSLLYIPRVLCASLREVLNSHPIALAKINLQV